MSGVIQLLSMSKCLPPKTNRMKRSRRNSSVFYKFIIKTNKYRMIYMSIKQKNYQKFSSAVICGTML